MNVSFRFDIPDEPPGKIRLTRLVTFAQRFQAAALRSAQAELSIPAFRKRLGSEQRPEFRLAALTGGSVGLTLESVDDREIDRLAVARHLDAIHSYKASGQWPSGFYRGELEAWSEVYVAAFRGTETATVEVTTEGYSEQVDRALVEDLSRANPQITLRRIECVGDLHMIEILPQKHPRFRIDADEVDLTFELTPDLRATVDALRWRRVKGEGLWEQGSNRAQLTGSLELSTEPPGVTIVDDVSVAEGEWLADQVARLGSFTATTHGWDGRGSQPTGSRYIESGSELLRRVEAQYRESIASVGWPVAFPTATGTVEFEWQVGSRFILAEITSVGYELLVTDGEEVRFEGVATQRVLFQWIGWLIGTGEAPA